MKLSIIMPVFNEENTIAEILEKVDNVRLPNFLKKELIVINDGSTDKTDEKLSKSKIRFKYIKAKQNSGKGAAIKLGLSEARGEIIIIQDADLEYNPYDYLKLVTPILEGRVKVVYGTRLKNYPLKFWGDKKTVLPTHLIANRFLTALTNILYGSNLTDMETGYKFFKKEVIEGIDLKARKFDFEPELTAKVLKKSIKILEVPILTNPRTYAQGKKIGIKDGIMAIWTLIKYRFVN